MPIKLLEKIIFILVIGAIIAGVYLGTQHSRVYNFSFLSQPFAPIKKTNNKPLNLLLLGIVGNGSRGTLLTDTIILFHVDPLKNQIHIISIPRDLWVKGVKYPQGTKINGLMEIDNPSLRFSSRCRYDFIKNKIEEITNQKINYTLVGDLEGMEALVNQLGGITVWLPNKVIDPKLVNPHYPEQIFQLPAGWNYLDGALAAKFLRSRYAPSGDFYRISHQHQFISALYAKIQQLNKIWKIPSWLKLWQGLHSHFVTNLDFNTAYKLFTIIGNIPQENIHYLTISNRPPDNLLLSTMIPIQGKNIYILIPREGIEHYQAIQKYINKAING